MQGGETNVENSALMIDFFFFFFKLLKSCHFFLPINSVIKGYFYMQHRKSYISLLHVIVRATRQKVWLPFYAAGHFIPHSWESPMQWECENNSPFSFPLAELSVWSRTQPHLLLQVIHVRSFHSSFVRWTPCLHGAASVFSNFLRKSQSGSHLSGEQVIKPCLEGHSSGDKQRPQFCLPLGE